MRLEWSNQQKAKTKKGLSVKLHSPYYGVEPRRKIRAVVETCEELKRRALRPGPPPVVLSRVRRANPRREHCSHRGTLLTLLVPTLPQKLCLKRKKAGHRSDRPFFVLKINGGSDGTRTHGLRRDRATL